MSNSYFNWKQKQLAEDTTPFDPPKDVPPLIRTKETGDKVYLVKDGYAHWITSPEVLKAVGGDFGMVQTIDRSVFRQLRIAEKIKIENAGQYKLPNPSKPPTPSNPPEEDFWGKSEVEVALEATNELNKADIPVSPVTRHEEIPFIKYDPPQEEVESAPKDEPEKGFTSIIIPAYWIHYPAFHYTGNCIGTIREHTDKEKTPYEIILVIDGKTGIQLDRLELSYADKVIVNEENLGYAKSVNKGIRVARGEYIAVINNDVQVFDHWLEDLQDALNHTDLIMGTPMYGKPFARAAEAAELRAKSIPSTPSNPVSSFSDFVDFSCFLTRKEVFQKIGLFDEQFKMYCEDLDFLRRMKEAGMKYASTKRVNTAHIIGATSSAIDDMPEIMNESKKKLKEKWGY